MRGDGDNRRETSQMNPLRLRLIPADQHNLVSDLVTATLRHLFIQVRWGSWGKSLCSRAQPPFHSIVTLPLCHVYTQPGDRMINGHARGAVDNFWCVYTKASSVPFAPVSPPPAGTGSLCWLLPEQFSQPTFPGFLWIHYHAPSINISTSFMSVVSLANNNPP